MKRIIALIMCFVFVLLAFAGCTTNNNTNDTDEQTTSSSIDFTYDSHYYFDDSVMRYYEQMCQAIIDRESELRFNQSIYQSVSQLLFTSFPLVDLIDKVQINHDMSGLTISYKYEEAQHNQIVADFTSKINQIKTQCKFGEVSNNEYIINVYNYVASNIQHSSNPTITVYETIMTGQGTSFTYSRMFEYILQQSNVQTSHVIAFDKESGTWALSIVMIDNSYYFCDVMKEFNDNAGTKLKFFGMTSDDVADLGLTELKFTDSSDVDVLISDDRFSPCRKCQSYIISENVLKITDKSNKVYEIVL